MIIHKKIKHGGLRYNCDQCDYHATIQNCLIQHKLTKHERVRYNCDKCDDVFTIKSNLAKHKHYRNGEVRYDCDQCNGIFMWQENHKNPKHEGIRFYCDQCDVNLHNRETLLDTRKLYMTKWCLIVIGIWCNSNLIKNKQLNHEDLEWG